MAQTSMPLPVPDDHRHPNSCILQQVGSDLHVAEEEEEKLGVDKSHRKVILGDRRGDHSHDHDHDFALVASCRRRAAHLDRLSVSLHLDRIVPPLASSSTHPPYELCRNRCWPEKMMAAVHGDHCLEVVGKIVMGRHRCCCSMLPAQDLVVMDVLKP